MNRLTAFSKGHNPDDPDIGEHAGVVKAFELNNVFFNVSCDPPIDPQMTPNWPPINPQLTPKWPLINPQLTPNCDLPPISVVFLL